ncbi:MAG: hypothetical protein C0631_01690 [Sedimenticola sp.]|nr:MAG: hypothetical protein C0631_01690 [Sedimenticola sp.]
MTIWEKSLLLLQLRQRLETERTTDWQTLHKRDRGWFLAQSAPDLWSRLRNWLDQWSAAPGSGIHLMVYGLSLVALILGFSLIAGLLEFLTFERINLLWFLLIAIALPFVWWLAALFFSAAQVPFPLATLVEHRLPRGIAVPAALRPLLKHTILTLGQQLSLLFAIGMLLAFLLYLLVTDLAFGWSSTLNLTGDLVHQMTSLIAWPWQQVWPAAVPSAELIEQTHYFRSAPFSAEQPALFGQWWRFLLMCLLVYVVIPRLITATLYRLQLKGMQRSVLNSDALISGLLQRLSTELIDHEAEQVEQLDIPAAPASAAPATIAYPQIISWGIWPDELIGSLHKHLDADQSAVYWASIDSPDKIDSTLTALQALPDRQTLLLCKGWEPPTGELADFCQQLGELRTRLFLWPVPLAGMSDARQQTLIQSWQAFMRQLPDPFHLITEPLAEGSDHE